MYSEIDGKFQLFYKVSHNYKLVKVVKPCLSGAMVGWLISEKLAFHGEE